MMLVRPTTPAAGEGDAGGTSWDRAHPGGNLWRWGFTRGGSPAQIAGRRRKMNPEDASRRVCHETIHAALYASCHAASYARPCGSRCGGGIKAVAPGVKARTGAADWST